MGECVQITNMCVGKNTCTHLLQPKAQPLARLMHSHAHAAATPAPVTHSTRTVMLSVAIFCLL